MSDYLILPSFGKGWQEYDAEKATGRPKHGTLLDSTVLRNSQGICLDTGNSNCEISTKNISTFQRKCFYGKINCCLYTAPNITLPWVLVVAPYKPDTFPILEKLVCIQFKLQITVYLSAFPKAGFPGYIIPGPHPWSHWLDWWAFLPKHGSSLVLKGK